MSKRDVLDEKMAPRFAWRVTAPEVLPREEAAKGTPLRVAAAVEQARKARTWDTFDSLVRLGCEGDVAEVLDVAERAVNEYDGEPGAFEPVCGAARELEKKGRIDAAWILERLRRPESPVFTIAVHLSWESPSEEVLEALRAALGSAAREGAAAAEAAHGLIAHQAMKIDDPRLAGLLERAPVYARASLTGALIDFEASPGLWRRHVLGALLSPEESVAAEVLEPLCAKRPMGTRELFEEVLSHPATAYVRSAVEHFLKSPDDPARYWQDLNDQLDPNTDAGSPDDEARKPN